MEERLTEKDSIDNKRYMLNSEENQITLTNAKLNNGFRKAYYWGKALDKLAQLEDIMEKYGIDIQNLDYMLEDYSKNQGRDFAICEERDTLRQERDTWKRACELACERDDDCYVYDNIHRAYEFYQQAKKDGNDE